MMTLNLFSRTVWRKSSPHVVSSSQEGQFATSATFGVKHRMTFRYRNVKVFGRTASPLYVHYLLHQLLPCAETTISKTVTSKKAEIDSDREQ